jgi:hypothetical protein
MRGRKTSQIALGGMFSALCLALMLTSGILPFSMLAIPALAGAMLIPVVVETGAKTAVMVYVSVSVLAAVIIADKLAAVHFICFLGYYPVLKSKIERVRPRPLEYALKLGLFNATAMLAYIVITYVLETGAAIENFGIALLGILNAVFIVYDFGLTGCASFYTHRLRKNICSGAFKKY